MLSFEQMQLMQIKDSYGMFGNPKCSSKRNFNFKSLFYGPEWDFKTRNQWKYLIKAVEQERLITLNN